MKTQVSALCAGLPRPFNGAEMSAIDKRPLPGPAAIRSFGIEGAFGDRITSRSPPFIRGRQRFLGGTIALAFGTKSWMTPTFDLLS